MVNYLVGEVTLNILNENYEGTITLTTIISLPNGLPMPAANSSARSAVSEPSNGTRIFFIMVNPSLKHQRL